MTSKPSDTHSWFALVQNPTNGAWLPLIEDDGYTLALFSCRNTALAAAWRNLFGSRGYYRIYQLSHI